jgi:ubiquinone/menaquinone biosynthesis C-methylase UbiE
MKKEISSTDYGNWVSEKMIRILLVVLMISVVLLIISFGTFTKVYLGLPIYIIRVIMIVLAAFFAFLLAYVFICRVLFSYNGKYKIQNRILDYVLDHLEFKNGRMLDIGCGNGALTIKAAKKFPSAHITGIDYWGPVWNFAKEQCERNAELEGVLDRVVFQKGDASKLDFPDESFDGAVSNFVFHEVKSQPDKRKLVREALRVVKTGGIFAFHDLYLEEHYYGNINELIADLKKDGLQEIHFLRSVDEEFIPKVLKSRFMLGKIGLMYGIK